MGGSCSSRSAIDIAHTLDARRPSGGVIDVIRRHGADPASGQAAQQLVTRHINVERGRDLAAHLAQHRVERLSLRPGAREAVEDGAFGRVGQGETVGDHLDRD
jgi:hypothetical protein